VLAQGAAEIALETALKTVDGLQHRNGSRLVRARSLSSAGPQKEKGRHQCRHVKERAPKHRDQQQGFDKAHELSGFLKT
jgi:hypothetical protein